MKSRIEHSDNKKRLCMAASAVMSIINDTIGISRRRAHMRCSAPPASAGEAKRRRHVAARAAKKILYAEWGAALRRKESVLWRAYRRAFEVA